MSALAITALGFVAISIALLTEKYLRWREWDRRRRERRLAVRFLAKSRLSVESFASAFAAMAVPARSAAESFKAFSRAWKGFKWQT